MGCRRVDIYSGRNSPNTLRPDPDLPKITDKITDRPRPDRPRKKCVGGRLNFVKFPSPQGGSETLKRKGVRRYFFAFPSPQGGSETLPFSGDGGYWSAGFHPLKAGRRPRSLVDPEPPCQEFPSPQGGSETSCALKMLSAHKSCHPLKAGRRPFVGTTVMDELPVFPSPQGGSETHIMRQL